jgi:hypothetical protein
MKSVSDVPLASVDWAASRFAPPVAPRFESRLPSWTQGPLYCGDDLPGVPLDCFTDAMIDDGSVSSWVPYSHNGLDAPVSESPCGSDEELQEMEVGDE